MTDLTQLALEEKIERVSVALQKLTAAAGSRPGADCYTHAALGQALLARLGVQSRLVAGYAAWRVGPGDTDVVAHHNGGKMMPQPGGVIYHAWLELAGDKILDLSTYQLRLKAQQLDQLDGGRTHVDWCPEYLFVRKADSRSYRQTAQAPQAGIFSYQRDMNLEIVLKKSFHGVDADDLEAGWVVAQNPAVIVYGPNDEARRRAPR
jgi:hypothetical protein